MFRRPNLLEQASQAATHTPVLLAFVGFFISLTVIFKTPSLWAILIPELGRLLQFLDINVHLHGTFILGYQAETCRNLATQIIARGDFASLEIGTHTLPFGTRIKAVLVAAACDISVIIPTLNEEKYLPRCLDSLTSQKTKERFEIIVVDGGSKDRTIQVAEEGADRVLVEPAQPVGGARNTGAKNAEGDILAFIDADTMACEDWLEEIAQTFHLGPSAVGVTGPTLPHEGTQLDRMAYHVATGWMQRLSFRLGRPHVAGFNCAYRKSAFWNAGGFDENRVLSEDVMLSLRMRHQGPIVFNPQMVAYTSLRRIKKYGYPYLTTYYIINAATMFLLDRSLGYPAIR